MKDSDTSPDSEDSYEFSDDPKERRKQVYKAALNKAGIASALFGVAMMGGCAGCNAGDDDGIVIADIVQSVGFGLFFWFFTYSIAYAVLWSMFLYKNS